MKFSEYLAAYPGISGHMQERYYREMTSQDPGPFKPRFWEAYQKSVECCVRGDRIGQQMYLAPWTRRFSDAT